jgi:hypothetical protein
MSNVPGYTRINNSKLHDETDEKKRDPWRTALNPHQRRRVEETKTRNAKKFNNASMG